MILPTEAISTHGLSDDLNGAQGGTRTLMPRGTAA